MKKYTAIILLVLCTTAYSEPTLLEINGNDWMIWTQEQKIGYVQGALAESYMMAESMLRLGYIPNHEVLYPIRIVGTSSLKIVSEITAYYRNTEEYECPLFIAIHIRNVWKSAVENEVVNR